ncbi:hypothetical protein [Aminobacter ciceronei]|uniref:Uncharacterized protein YecT (DUF1311 family) n=2 Tax=Aminobacter ciceronei TaxID=150723 RepID=A0ABR6C5X5_9HYPH|nr:hypothetical protein [Aminobacter ciceronei]MBA8906466.1 uncharacterized protein YecT (DUF1311 family) [Aminobacter ciceronei]MBA9020408.1 uncharacterized protein YecT (DUF1311 family) [Aminobacter ciceronei]
MAVLASVLSAAAAEIELIDLPGEVDVVSIKGEITEGDGDRFYDLIQGRQRISVLLQSPGGLVKEALQIGAQVRLQNYATMVMPDGECFSACGLIWVAGARRYMSASSSLGFHAAYRQENGEYKESGVANAEIGSYLTHLGLRIEAIRFFTIAGPNDFLLLTPARARALGIDVFEQAGTSVTTPSQSPTVDIYADRFVSYGVLRSRCAGFFQVEERAFELEAKDAAQKGQQIAGNDAWIDVWSPMLEEAKTELNAKGPLMVCLETEAHLRENGLRTGIDGPSFDCRKATTQTEQALCDDPRLWAKDRAMNAIYLFIRSYNDAKVRKALLANQRAWLKERNSCGADPTCLRQSYDDRFQLMKAIDVGTSNGG